VSVSVKLLLPISFNGMKKLHWIYLWGSNFPKVEQSKLLLRGALNFVAQKMRQLRDFC
jgi:hypothetical protein